MKAVRNDVWRARLTVIPRLAERAEGPRNCNGRLLEAKGAAISVARSLGRRGDLVDDTNVGVEYQYDDSAHGSFGSDYLRGRNSKQTRIVEMAEGSKQELF